MVMQGCMADFIGELLAEKTYYLCDVGHLMYYSETYHATNLSRRNLWYHAMLWLDRNHLLPAVPFLYILYAMLPSNVILSLLSYVMVATT